MKRDEDIGHLREDRYKGSILSVSENGDGKQKAVLGLENKVKICYADGRVEEIDKLPALSPRNLILISRTARLGLELGGGEDYKFEKGEVVRYEGNLLELLLKKLGERVNRPIKSVEILGSPAEEIDSYYKIK